MGTTAVTTLAVLKHIHPNGLPAGFRLLELGSQNISGAAAEFVALARYLGHPRPDDLAVYGQRNNDLYCKELFGACGISYESIDLDAGATLRLDLNTKQVPWRLRRSFDVVTNFGTTEHVFNQMNCFQLIHDATKVGGAMVHMVPSTGYMWHCLFKYDPKFFLALAEANGYEILYAGFGPTEPGRVLSGECDTWANQHLIQGQRFDSHLVEFIFRKVAHAPFRPGIDLLCDGYAGRKRFDGRITPLRG